jgi:hypothetical protein
MQILFVWIDDYGCLEKQGLNLGGKYVFTYDHKTRYLQEKENRLFKQGFFNEHQSKNVSINNVSAIIGQNGTGKSTFLNFIIENLTQGGLGLEYKAVLVFEQDGSSYAYSSLDEPISYSGISIPSQNIYHIPLKSEYPTDSFNNDSSRKISEFYQVSFVRYAIGFDGQNRMPFSGTHDISTNYLIRNDYQFHSPSENIDAEDQFTKGRATSKYRPIEVERHRYQEIVRQLNLIYDLDEYPSLLQSVIDDIHLPNKVSLTLQKLFVKSEPKWDVDVEKPLDILERVGIATHTKFFSNQKLKDWVLYLKIEIVMWVLYSASRASHVRVLSEDSVLFSLPETSKTPNDLLNKLLDQFEDKRFLSAAVSRSSIEIFLNLIESCLVPGLSSGLPPGSFILDIQNKPNFNAFLSAYGKATVLYGAFNFDWREMSSGEKSRLALFGRLHSVSDYRSISRLNKDVILLMDEGDLYFHPEWQRQYIDTVLKFLTEDWKPRPAKHGFPEILNRNIQIIITSNNPIVTSDLPKQSIVFLKRGSLKKSEVVDGQERELMASFGANIHDLFSHSFFMNDGFIGKFAENKIKRYLNEIEEAIKNKMKLSKYKIQEIYTFAEIIDEPFISAGIKAQISKLVASDERALYKEFLIKKKSQIDDELNKWEDVQ